VATSFYLAPPHNAEGTFSSPPFLVRTPRRRAPSPTIAWLLMALLILCNSQCCRDAAPFLFYSPFDLFSSHCWSPRAHLATSSPPCSCFRRQYPSRSVFFGNPRVLEQISSRIQTQIPLFRVVVTLRVAVPHRTSRLTLFPPFRAFRWTSESLSSRTTSRSTYRKSEDGRSCTLFALAGSVKALRLLSKIGDYR